MKIKNNNIYKLTVLDLAFEKRKAIKNAYWQKIEPEFGYADYNGNWLYQYDYNKLDNNEKKKYNKIWIYNNEVPFDVLANIRDIETCLIYKAQFKKEDYYKVIDYNFETIYNKNGEVVEYVD